MPGTTVNSFTAVASASVKFGSAGAPRPAPGSNVNSCESPDGWVTLSMTTLPRLVFVKVQVMSSAEAGVTDTDLFARSGV